MYAFRLRTAAVALAATVGLSACTTPFGYGGVGVGTGYNDPYYGGYGYGAGYPASGYGYGYGAGYPASGYGYGYGAGYPGYGYGYQPYYGWYDNFYYPGSGYYVYDQYRNPYPWSDEQRRYWEGRRDNAMSSKEFRRAMEARQQNWDGFSAGPTATTQQVLSSDGQRVRTQRIRPVRTDGTTTQATRDSRRAERAAARAERAATRTERKSTTGRQSSKEFRASMTGRNDEGNNRDE